MEYTPAVLKRYPEAAALLRRTMRERGLPVPDSTQPGATGAGAPRTAVQDARSSIWDGVYTEAQAKRGEQSYAKSCAKCHAEDLLGSAQSLFGQGKGMNTLTAEAAVSHAVDLSPQLGLGIEYGFRNFAFIRGGKHFYNDDRAAGTKTKGTYGLSGGLGVRIPVQSRAIKFDYSYTSMGELQNTQVFSFEFGR